MTQRAQTMVAGAPEVGSPGRSILALTERLKRALDATTGVHDYLAEAQTIVRFAMHDLPEQGVTVSLTPGFIGVCEPAAVPDVRIELSPGAVEEFAGGALPVGVAIAEGRAQLAGDGRRYLEVDPIIRGLLRDRGDHVPAAAFAHTNGWSPPAPPDGDAVMAIETRDLCKAFGSHEVLLGADVQIPEGTLAVVLGPSGTGKSVLIKHIVGSLTPDGGDVRVRGRSLRGIRGRDLDMLRREIGVMYQDGALFSSMSVYDNVAFSLREHTNMNEREIGAIVLEHLAAVGLEQARDLYPAQLSGGMRKRAGLARAVVLEPRILLCDEPDSGLDPVRTALLGELLSDWHAQHGGTIVVVTHNIALARSIGEHLTLLWKGRVAISGSRETFFATEDPLVRQFIEGDAVGPLGMD
jgi:phospholipid/cholesterol/gamma-HCH transport system ATP-binding protein